VGRIVWKESVRRPVCDSRNIGKAPDNTQDFSEAVGAMPVDTPTNLGGASSYMIRPTV